MFDKIDELVWLSAKPLTDEYLEDLQEREVHPEKYYRFLYHLVSDRKPAVSLEIGLLHGLGSLHMAIAAAKYGGHVIGLDRTTDFLWDVVEVVEHGHPPNNYKARRHQQRQL